MSRMQEYYASEKDALIFRTLYQMTLQNSDFPCTDLYFEVVVSTGKNFEMARLVKTTVVLTNLHQALQTNPSLCRLGSKKQQV